MSKIRKNIFNIDFLSDFILVTEKIPFSDEEIRKYDQKLEFFEQAFIDPDIERNLISRNEILASFGISKAEGSALTLTEAQQVYQIVVENPDFDFIKQKIKKSKHLNQKDYEKLEYFNIAKTFRLFNQKPFGLKDLTSRKICQIHQMLTGGMDIFYNQLSDFTVYKSGQWRDNDLVRVGDYIPSPAKQIKKNVDKLAIWLKNNFSITNVAVFHTALYALHPFNNGNKRTCRILEHLLLKAAGLNQKNLYSPSYFYHKLKARYYKYLSYSLLKKNFTFHVCFILESIMLSVLDVVKLSIESQRMNFLKQKVEKKRIKKVLGPLVKTKKISFSNLYKRVRKKMARQTFVNVLKKAEVKQVVKRRKVGRKVWYSLNLKTPEEKTYQEWKKFIRPRLGTMPLNVFN